SCSRFTKGGVLPAVNTVTGAPPPCGVKAMLITLTPIVPQSSDESSLTRTDRLPVWGVVVVFVAEEPAEPEPPPHATTPAVRLETRIVWTACLNLASCI